MDSELFPPRKFRLGPIPMSLLEAREKVNNMLQHRHRITPHENLIIGVTVATISEIDVDAKECFEVLKKLYKAYHRILKDRTKYGGAVSTHLMRVSSAAEKELLDAKRVFKSQLQSESTLSLSTLSNEFQVFGTDGKVMEGVSLGSHVKKQG